MKSSDMLISASLFSRKKEWRKYAQELELIGVDCLHIDYTEGDIPPILPSELNNFSSNIPLDVHLIYKSISKGDVQQFNETMAKYLCVQYENVQNKSDINFLKYFKGFKGVAILYETSIEQVLSEFDYLDFILIMCTQPGVSGATFNEKNLEKIKIIRERYPRMAIHADGGIDTERAEIMKRLGVRLCVCGSYLAMSQREELVKRVCNLKYLNSDVKVNDILILPKYIKQTNANSNFCQMLEDIETTGLGTAFISDDDGNYLGLVTDGDVRRQLVKHNVACFEMCAVDFVNRKSYTVHRTNLLSEILLEKMLLNKSVLIIPVIEQNKLVGAVDLTKIL